MSERPLRILVIEDDPDDVCLLREALAAAGPGEFAIYWAPTLAAGLERLRSHPVDALLVDLGLPDSQGMATLAAIAGQAPQLPVVVMTGLNDENLAMEAVHRGAQDYLVKGQMSGDLVVRALRYAVEREGAEQHILHLNAVLRAIRGVNQLIGRERDRQQLIQGICDELAAVTGYLSAWIMIFGQHKGAPLLARAGVEAPGEYAPGVAPACLPDCMAEPSAALFRSGPDCGDCRQCGLGPGL